MTNCQHCAVIWGGKIWRYRRKLAQFAVSLIVLVEKHFQITKTVYFYAARTHIAIQKQLQKYLNVLSR